MKGKLSFIHHSAFIIHHFFLLSIHVNFFRLSTHIEKLMQVPGLRGVIYRLGVAGRRAAFAARSAADYARLRAARTGTRPGVTAVVVGRNDDYMPDFRQRLEATVRWNHEHLADEVIFVEWNPPPERDLLAKELTRKFPFVRAYVVPPEIHDAVCHNPNIKLL